MNVTQRRKDILTQLKASSSPVPAGALAARFHVSRQVIVQDVAVIRVSHPGLLSTNRGYLYQQENVSLREFKVRHSGDRAAEELTIIVDLGGHVKNISISHRCYGRVTAEMSIASRQDVLEYVQTMGAGNSSHLSNATGGYHYHLVEAVSEQRLDIIEQELKKHGFLAPLRPWEKAQGNLGGVL